MDGIGRSKRLKLKEKENKKEKKRKKIQLLEAWVRIVQSVIGVEGVLAS